MKNRSWSLSNGRTCQNLVLGAPRLDFVRLWGPPRPLLCNSGALLGASWALLGASWALLRRLVSALGCLLAAKCCPRGAEARFLRLPGASREGFGGPKTAFFKVFACISLYNGFNSAVTTLLHFPTLYNALITAQNPQSFSPTFIFIPSGAAVCAQHME